MRRPAKIHAVGSRAAAGTNAFLCSAEPEPVGERHLKLTHERVV